MSRKPDTVSLRSEKSRGNPGKNLESSFFPNSISSLFVRLPKGLFGPIFSKNLLRNARVGSYPESISPFTSFNQKLSGLIPRSRRNSVDESGTRVSSKSKITPRVGKVSTAIALWSPGTETRDWHHEP